MIDLAIRIVNPVIADKVFEDLGLMRSYGAAVVPKRGVHIFELPRVAIVDGEYDAEGNQTRAPVYSPQQHFNIRISTVPLVDDFITFLEDAVNANKPAQANKSETVWKWRGVEIIDMSAVSSPKAVTL